LGCKSKDISDITNTCNGA